MSTIRDACAAGSAPFICIYASQVAMCIGANKHKKISEALELVWQRCDPTGFRAALRRNGVKTEDEIAEGIIKSNSDIRTLVDLTLKAPPCESSAQVASKYDAVTRELRAVSLAEEERRVVVDVLKRNLYTAYGNSHETNVLEYIRNTLGIACTEDHTFYKAEAGVCSGSWGSVQWFVGGKIDAIDNERTLLIEIKNRVNRLFHRVPFYEQVQVQAYLHLLNLERGVLVECLKAGEWAVNVIPVARDRDLWERDIVPKLQGFVDFLGRVLHDAGTQDRYFQSKRRSAMITSHVNGYVKSRHATIT